MKLVRSFGKRKGFTEKDNVKIELCIVSFELSLTSTPTFDFKDKLGLSFESLFGWFGMTA